MQKKEKKEKKLGTQIAQKKRKQKHSHTKKRDEGEEMKSKLGQNWSLDLIIGVIIFVMVISVFYAILNTETKSGFSEVKEDAHAAIAKISTNSETGINLIKDGVIDKEEYDILCLQSYDEVRELLNIESEFCIYLEDFDGNIILCENGRAGIGNGKDFLLSNTTTNVIYCGDIVAQ